MKEWQLESIEFLYTFMFVLTILTIQLCSNNLFHSKIFIIALLVLDNEVLCNAWFYLSDFWTCEKSILIDDVSNIMSHKKFLLIPMNPPILDRRVLSSIVHEDLVMSTTFSNLIVNPLLLFSLKPISLAGYLFTWHGTEHFP